MILLVDRGLFAGARAVDKENAAHWIMEGETFQGNDPGFSLVSSFITPFLHPIPLRPPSLATYFINLRRNSCFFGVLFKVSLKKVKKKKVFSSLSHTSLSLFHQADGCSQYRLHTPPTQTNSRKTEKVYFCFFCVKVQA